MFISKKELKKRINEAQEQAVNEFMNKQWERERYDRLQSDIHECYKRLLVLEEKAGLIGIAKVTPNEISPLSSSF